MKTYQAKYNPLTNKGVYGISLVENPAMEGLFIALSKDEVVQFKTVDEEQRILMGLVLEPNKPIYRNQNGEEFNIVFNEQTIKDLSYGFFKNNSHSNSTIEHDIDQNIKGVTFTESWIVENPTNDKSNNFGFSYPKGSWVAVMKVDSDEVWNDYVKTGKVQGFSIDAMLSLEEVKLSKNKTTTGVDIWFKDSMITKGCNVQTLDGKDLADGTYELMTNLIIDVKKGEVVNLKSNIEMSNTNTLLERILLALTPKQAEIKLGSVMLADGSVKIEFEGEEMKVGDAIWVVAEDGTKVPVPVGEHPLEEGTVLIVTVEGVVGEIKPAEAPADETPAPAVEAAGEDGKVSNDAKIASEIESAIKSILIKYTAQEQTISELKEQIAELSKQPASKPIQGIPVQIDFSKMTKQERILNTINKHKN